MRQKKAVSRSKNVRSSNCELILKILEMMKKHSDNVKWSEDGTKVRFVDIKYFQKNILPRYFRHSNMMSFIRQLNMYYFTKAAGDDENEMMFQHSIFRRGNEQSFKRIEKRNKIRDDLIESMNKQYKLTLETIENENKMSGQLKNLVNVGMQYTEMIDTGMKKIKLQLNNLVKENATSRGEVIKSQLQNIKKNFFPSFEKIKNKLSVIQSFMKNNLCKDVEKIEQSHSRNYPPIISDEPQSFRQLPLMNLRSVNSLVPAEQLSSFDDSFGEKAKLNDDQEISIEQGLESAEKNYHKN